MASSWPEVDIGVAGIAQENLLVFAQVNQPVVAEKVHRTTAVEMEEAFHVSQRHQGEAGGAGGNH